MIAGLAQRALIVIAPALLLSIPAAATSAQVSVATAQLRNAAGAAVGSATFTQQAGGVQIDVQVRNLPPGLHGIHLHAAGRCDPPDFTTAGGHFNPGGRQHGAQNPQGAHAGDLPNITIAADGTGRLSLLHTSVTIETGASALLREGGTALVIHADVDDERTDPTGNSGGRIACGVILAAAGAAVQVPAQVPGALPRTGAGGLLSGGSEAPLLPWAGAAALSAVAGVLLVRRRTAAQHRS